MFRAVEWARGCLAERVGAPARDFACRKAKSPLVSVRPFDGAFEQRREDYLEPASADVCALAWSCDKQWSFAECCCQSPTSLARKMSKIGIAGVYFGIESAEQKSVSQIRTKR